ncbi:restriction endonuclease subunit S [Hornefia butyriciproducens]|uniref:restriction endonuclease subunit S n=1 Tax=Hornefia butyriciproducens TaxID=2652293 RepID=UPI003F8A02FC
MSRLSELINELCPDGVEYKKIKDMYQRLKGTPITAAKMKEISNDAGDIRVFAGGKTVINAFEEDIPKANITRVPAVLVQSRGVIDAVYYDKPFTFKNEMWAYTSDDIIKVKFLYYVLKNNIEHFREAASGMGSLPQISLKVTEEFRVPVPPLEVQREIVRILDSFTLLTAELTAELTARQQQYKYYSKYLLCHAEGAVDTPIEELGKWQGGKTPSMANPDYWNNGSIPWISSKDMKVAVLEDTQDHITNEAISNGGMKLLPAGVTAIVTRSGILKHTFPVAYVPVPCTINQDIKALIVKEDVDSRFAALAIQAFSDDIRVATKKQGGTVDSLEFGKILSFKIPVPPLDEQLRVVQTLDRFDSICNDIASGIPAEIEARQKQYEYYRDKLLTFKEKEA